MASSNTRYGILDPLRFFAAIAVIFYHYSIHFYGSESALYQVSKYGYLGVDFFFVLSGFVIMASAQNRSAFEFAVARALRIYPAFIICLLLTIAALTLVGGQAIPLKDAIFNALIVNDYLGIKNIDGVYWTLQAELKFYGCIFILIFLGVLKKWQYWLSIWMTMAVMHFFIKQPFFMGWFINPGYSFYFMGGVCAYLLTKEPKNILANAIFFVSLIFGFFCAKSQSQHFLISVTEQERIVAGVAVVAIFSFFYLLSRGYFSLSSNKFLLALGALSYPVYLLHNMAGKTFIDALSAKESLPFWIMVGITLVILTSYLVVRVEEKVRFSLRGLIKVK
ncbi:acyltransferase [Cellvibrio sp. KY-GH-1]|uniref:acyltransferase family protein n=1 Tax=Cellvibrio sp. KY-GH-1 TaxID=2303332 RepID=UPI001247C2A2|nr:acyltransferase [Cellvibrio sp. KY-GH-1]QEY17298.1 acyltransferase [Cellvibrio sp. KY-GH-1]